MKRFILTLIGLSIFGCSILDEGIDGPESCGPIAEQSIFTGNSTTFEICFTSSTGSMLTYSVESDDLEIVIASIEETTVTISAVSPGSAMITATATDAENSSTDQQVAVRIPNRAPEIVGSIEPISVRVGSTYSFDIDDFFSDPDMEKLTYTAETNDASIATPRISNATLEVTGANAGSTTITVIATDQSGESASQLVLVYSVDITEIFTDHFDLDSGRWLYNKVSGGLRGGMKIKEGKLSVWSEAPYLGIAEADIGAEAWNVTVSSTQTLNAMWSAIGIVTSVETDPYRNTLFFLFFGDNRGLSGYNSEADIELLIWNNRWNTDPSWRKQTGIFKIGGFNEVSLGLEDGNLHVTVNGETTIMASNDMVSFPFPDRIEKLWLISNPRNGDAVDQSVLFDWVRVEGAVTNQRGGSK